MDNEKIIELLAEYMRKAEELEPDTIGRDGIKEVIEKFVKYRTIRTKQVVLSRIKTDKYNFGEVKTELREIDERRRDVHNDALEHLIMLSRYGQRLGLEPIYNGNLLTFDEIEKHDDTKHEVRKEMTDAMFSILNAINDYQYSVLNDQEKKDLLAFQREMDHEDHQYKIAEGLREDDGDIVFDDDKMEKLISRLGKGVSTKTIGKEAFKQTSAEERKSTSDIIDKEKPKEK